LPVLCGDQPVNSFFNLIQPQLQNLRDHASWIPTKNKKQSLQKKKKKFWTVLNRPEMQKNRLESIPDGLKPSRI
jgi:hypothetical protein